MSPLTPRQQVIIDLLSEGPRTMRELAVACGYAENDRGGHNYVSVVLGRLGSRGYGFHNYTPVGSKRGACYVLMTRPREASSPLAASRARCAACGAYLARDHREDRCCSPCQRSGLDAELEMLAPPTLFPVSGGLMTPAATTKRFATPPNWVAPHSDRLTTRRALLRLTERRPNEIVTTADVCAELGYEVGRGAIGNAAVRLRRDIAIEGVPGSGGGYVKLVPMPTLGAERCANCWHRDPGREPGTSACDRTHWPRVGLNCRCWGWEAL